MLAYESAIEEFAGYPALVIERYDRTRGGQRIHQEDFNQALGASGNEKYQEYAGVVTLRRVADTLTRFAPLSSLVELARQITFAVAIGDLDKHTKNISLLHSQDGSIKLAPAYDCVPQLHHRNDGKFALAINGKYHHRTLKLADLIQELQTWGLPAAENVVADTLAKIEHGLTQLNPLPGAYPKLQEEIFAHLQHLRN